jgi:hypothetical protein
MHDKIKIKGAREHPVKSLRLHGAGNLENYYAR